MTDEITSEDKLRVLTENTAQGVRKHLLALERNRQAMQTRWVWELLQNARDAQASMASIEYDQESVVFRHNGSPFNKGEITHLIYHGSTKTENEGAIGQYGSGFLATHLLSSTIHVSGRVDTGKFFNFPLKREIGSAESLKKLMEDAEKKYHESRSNESTVSGDFTTEFRYPIQCDKVKVAQDGIDMLKQCAPLVVTFNQFENIEIKSPDESMGFKVSRKPLKNGLQEVAILVLENGNERNEYVLVADDEGGKTSIAIPFQKKSATNGRYSICDVGSMPKLFLGFPLVKTDDFSFPAIINSFQFTPTEDRDGVYLATSADDANEKNRQVIEVVWNLLIDLLEFVAACNYQGVYKLATIPSIPQHKWLDGKWLHEVNERFVAEIRKTSAVVVGDKVDPISPKSAILPIAGTDEGVETLWGLLNDMPKNHARLPEKGEAVGWCNAVKSWERVSDQHPDIGFDCQKMAAEIHNAHENGDADKKVAINDILRLKQDVDPIGWLNRFHALINREGVRDKVDDYRIVLTQEGQLRKLSELHRDARVAAELKDIAECLEWPIRSELRDERIDALDKDPGAGKWDGVYVVKQLIEKLDARNRSDANLDDAFAKASVGIFKWIAEQKNWDFLRGFPAFAIKGDDDKKRHLVSLPRHPQEADDAPCLAPIRSWPGDLQIYSDLFPKGHILADAFFDAVPDSDVWQHLNGDGLAKNCVIIKATKKDVEPIPDDHTKDKGEEKHSPAEGITVINIAFLTKDSIGIMSRVPGNQRLARLFWRFLVDWLLVQEPQGLDGGLAKCANPDCDSEHEYPLAEWLVPVKKNQWVPVGNRKTALANAESLGKLFQNAPDDCPQNTDGLTNLLEAIDVRNPDLFRIGLATTKEQKALVSLLNSGNLDVAYEIVEDCKDDPEIRGYLADRRKQKQTARKNHELGEQVEELVREILEKEGGFKVDKIRVGADFEITPAPEIDDVTKFELASPSQSKWLVEVKSTRRGPDGVRMTLAQAREADSNKENYLLCVVPLDGDEPELGVVREKMRFVQNIGNDVAKLVSDFDEFDTRRNNITMDAGQEVQLSISPGTERVLVKTSVWEERGFPLDELAKRLKP